MAEGDKSALRMSERSNELTDDIDVADPIGIIRLMRACDGQMYSGYKHFPSLADQEVRAVMEETAALAAECIAAPHESAVILSGAGTSGRLAYMISRKFNKLLACYGRKPCFHYLLAGGDEALFQAKELAEDDSEAAVADLLAVQAHCEASRKKKLSRVLLVGITCGLSATYVGAQIEYALKQPHYAVALVGFNPVGMARRSPVEGWGSTFYDVAARLEQFSDQSAPEERHHFIITPVVGPEAITGSTRLKGGTATKVVLEALFGHAASRVLQQPFLGGPPPTQLNPRHPAAASSDGDLAEENGGYHGAGGGRAVQGPYTVGGVVDACEATCRAAYGAEEQLQRVVEMACDSLVARRRIHYVGAGGAGIMGLIDASEQVPTFGADPKDVRGFVAGGWDTLHEGCHLWEDAAGELELPNVDATTLMGRVMAKASSSDLLVVLHNPHGEGAALSAQLISDVGHLKQRTGIQLALVQVLPSQHDRLVCVECDGAHMTAAAAAAAEATARSQAAASAALAVLAARCDAVVTVHLPAAAAAPIVPGVDLFGELAVKHVLNAVSTGAHVLVGKVYQSRMVDVRLSNDKLFHRAVRIVSELGEVPSELAEEYVLRAIYGIDSGVVPDEVFKSNPAAHVREAKSATRVVPTALLLASGLTLGAAHMALRGKCNVRVIVKTAKAARFQQAAAGAGERRPSKGKRVLHRLDTM